MDYNELVTRINEAYKVIDERLQIKKSEYEMHGITIDRVQYEDVDLSDILDEKLVQLLPYLIEIGLNMPYEIRCKVYKVYVASLCEIVKNGLVNGGILKTMYARMGQDEAFSLSKHYLLLSAALDYEGIKVIDKHRKYEETIIYEAGIPRGYHKKCFELYNIYWKWLHNYDHIEREDFLRKFINKQPLDKVYIIDKHDRQRIELLRDEVFAFGEKVIKTCLRLDRVFTELDNYEGEITEENISEVADIISAKVGFDIFTVIRSKQVKQFILEYAKRISFVNFQKMLQSLPDNEEIILPNGIRKAISSYCFPEFIGGIHRVRGNAYDVSFPIALSIDDIFTLEQNKLYHYGNAVIYTSNEPIDAEIDGYEKTSRTFIKDSISLRYVFYERIPAGTFAYIDNLPVQCEKTFYKKVFISKCWDNDCRHYRLALCINEIRFADPKYVMRTVEIQCNDSIIINSSTNRNGAYHLQNKYFILENELLCDELHFKFVVNTTTIDEWNIELRDYYLWGEQSGLRIQGEINLAQWIGNHKILLFAKNQFINSSFDTRYLYFEQGYYVFEGKFDVKDSSITVGDEIIPILMPQLPYLQVNCPVEMLSEQLCINEDTLLSVSVVNYDQSRNDIIIQITHENNIQSYNIRNLQEEDYQDIRRLLPCSLNSSYREHDSIGKWNVSLFQEGKKVHTVTIVVLPQIEILPTKKFYTDGKEVWVELISASPCFESEGVFVRKRECRIGVAGLQFVGNLVRSSELIFDCYIDRCGVQYHFCYTPLVWGIKSMNTASSTWSKEIINRISVNQLKEYGFFICTTTDLRFEINASGSKIFRCYKPGYSRINILPLFQQLQSINKLTFTDEYDSKYELYIVYNCEITITDVRYLESSLIATFVYHGPVATTIEIGLFSKGKIIDHITKEAYHNVFSITAYESRKDILGEEIVVQGRMGKQDYQVIGRISVDASKFDKYTRTISVSKDTKIMDIIRESVVSTDRRFSYSIIKLLNNGG